MLESKSEYIAKYLERKLKKCNLPYGLEYLNLVAKLEAKAERKYEEKRKRIPSRPEPPKDRILREGELPRKPKSKL